MMNSAFISLGNVFNDLIRSSSAAERVLSLIDARPDVNPDEGEVITREGCKGAMGSNETAETCAKFQDLSGSFRVIS